MGQQGVLEYNLYNGTYSGWDNSTPIKLQFVSDQAKSSFACTKLPKMVKDDETVIQYSRY